MMNPRIKSVVAGDDYTLQLVFTNGEQGIYDCQPLLDFGVFCELRDLNYFKQVRADGGTVVWPHEQDICPDTLYEDSKKRAADSWMEKTIEQSIMESRQRKVTTAEAESATLIDSVPFGAINEEWNKFKGQLRESDELWYFCTPEETWTTLFPRCGLEGYVIVRDGKLFDELLTSVS